MVVARELELHADAWVELREHHEVALLVVVAHIPLLGLRPWVIDDVFNAWYG